MAYRRRHSMPRATTLVEDLAGASAAGDNSSRPARPVRSSSERYKSCSSSATDPSAFEYASMASMEGIGETKNGFWGILARKAKAILEDDNAGQQLESWGGDQARTDQATANDQSHQSLWRSESSWKTEDSLTQRSSDALASSLDKFGSTLRNALEEGLTVADNKTVDNIEETSKPSLRRKGNDTIAVNVAAEEFAPQNPPQTQTEHEAQLKATRDVANSMAAKAKLLLRELKTVKADLAFAKQRCTQLEEENKILRESHEKGERAEDDELIRLQLETLLAEKARLAHQNTIYARENRFLREIVEYHQPAMQNIFYLVDDDEDDAQDDAELSDSNPVTSPHPSSATRSFCQVETDPLNTASELSSTPNPIYPPYPPASSVASSEATPAAPTSTSSFPDNADLSAKPIVLPRLQKKIQIDF